MSADDIRNALSLSAFVASMISIFLTRRLWLQSNRPIVTAFVDENSSGNIATTFNLVVANTGNRPATDVWIEAEPSDVEKLLGEGATETMAAEIRRCFVATNAIPLLRNNEELTTAFGSYGTQKSSRQINYGESISITVHYRDLEGRKYRSRLDLKIYARHGFGGGVWKIKYKA